MFLKHIQQLFHFEMQIKNQQGYSALLAVVMISVSVTVVAISLVLRNIDTQQGAFLFKKSTDALYLAEACANEGILRLKNSADSGYNYSGGVLDATNGFESGDSCSIMVTQVLTQYTLDIEAESASRYIKRIRVVVETSPQFSVESWQEVGE